MFWWFSNVRNIISFASLKVKTTRTIMKLLKESVILHKSINIDPSAIHS